MKKVLSLILALAMVIGMVPMTLAAEPGEEAVRQSYRYVFNSAAHGGSGNVEMNIMDGSSTNVHTYEKIASNVSDPWEFVAMNAPYNYSQLKTADKRMEIVLSHPKNADESIGTLVYNPDNMSGAARPAGVCLKIKIDKPGTYRPIIEYLPDDNGVITEVYLTKTVVEATKQTGGDEGPLGRALKNTPQSDRIGVVDSYGAYEATTADTVKPQVLRNITVSEEDIGDYYLIFVYNGKNAAVKNEVYGMFYPVRFTLDEVTGLESRNNSYDYRFTAGDGIKLKQGDYANDANAVPVVNDFKNPGYVAAGVDYIPHFTNTPPKTDNYATYLNGNYIDTAKSAVWAFGERYNEYNLGMSSNVYNDGLMWNGNKVTTAYMAIKLTIPEKGRYYLSIDPEYSADANLGGAFGISFFSAEGITAKEQPLTYSGEDATAVNNAIGAVNTTENTDMSLAAAKNYISDYSFNINNPDSSKDGYVTIGAVDVPESGDYYLVFTNKATNTGNGYSQMKIKAAKLNSVEIISEAAGDVNAGNATASDITLGTTTVNVIAQDISGATIGVTKTTEYSVGASVSETAVTPGDDYTFLYWATGLGENLRIASFEEKYDFTVEQGEAMWLRAVYSKDAAEKTSVVFYDANRDELSRKLVNVGEKVTTPDLPYMAGYGNATGWVNGITGEAVTGDITASGAQMLFVADYPEAVNETVDITVSGGTVTNAMPIYGTDVTVTATSRENGTGNRMFSHWIKTVDGTAEIVSFNKEYTFKAWEDCTLTAVYADYAPLATTIRKILIGNKDTTAVWVAEFILGGATAKEKGFIFGGDTLETAKGKAAMKEAGNYFSVTDDVDGTPVGYAILSDDTVIYSK